MLLSLSARHTGDNSKQALDALTGIWWRKFGHLPDGLLVPAFELALDTCKFFPSIAEFNDLLRTVAKSEGAVVDGATAWDAIERAIIGRWSEAGDRMILSAGTGYPWPDDRCKRLVRDAMNLRVRDIATMHPAEYARTRDDFIRRYDQAEQVERAQVGVGVLPTPLRQIGGG